MKTLILARRAWMAVLLLIAGTVAAAGQPTLRMAFHTADGAVATIDAKSLEMTVTADKLIADNGVESLEFDLQDLVKMHFTGGASGVALVPEDETDGGVTVFTLDGKLAGKYPSAAAALGHLQPGMYIVRSSDDKTLKIAVQ